MTEPSYQSDGYISAFPRWPTTVWPCPPPHPAGPAEQTYARWLLAAVEQLVTGYTRPGDPVLLLSVPGRDGVAAYGLDSAGDLLSEAVWSVARLGRAVRSRPAPAVAVDGGRSRRGSESGPGPGPGPMLDPADGDPGPDWTPAGDPGSDWTAVGDSGPDRTRAGDAGRFALVIIAVTPSGAGGVDMDGLAALLTPTGTLAVITNSDSRGGWLIDPTGELSDAASHAGLALVDRIILLEIPLDGPAPPPDPLPARMVAERVHSDLLLFMTVAGAPPRPDGERR